MDKDEVAVEVGVVAKNKKLPVIDPLVQQIMDKVLEYTEVPSRHNEVLKTTPGTEDPIILAYMAGFFDGEGCVIIRKNKKKHNIFKTVHVNLGQNSKFILEYIDQFYLGTFYTYKPDKDKNKLTKLFYHWTLTGTRAVKFLHDIYPYTIVKREAIEKVIKEKYHD